MTVIGRFAVTREDAGSATVWVIGAIGLVSSIAVGMVGASSAIAARHATQRTADLVALAAAAEVGRSNMPCRTAERLAAANGVALDRCVASISPSLRAGAVRIEVSRVVRLPLVGPVRSHARARAGRVPA